MRTWYIAEGQLYRVDESGGSLVESAFAREAIERGERSRRIDGWKAASPDDDDRGRLVPRAALWGGSAGAATPVQPRFRHVARGRDDCVYYVVTIGGGTALFRYLPSERREIRLFHGAAMHCLGIAADPNVDRVVLAAGNADGTASLEIVDREAIAAAA